VSGNGTGTGQNINWPRKLQESQWIIPTKESVATPRTLTQIGLLLLSIEITQIFHQSKSTMKWNLLLLLAALVNAAQAVDIPIVGDLCGQVLVPGVYTAGACGLACPLELDANGIANPEWTFKCSGAFVAAASAGVFFTNAGSSENVFWEIGAASGVGAGSTMIGNMVSVGAITVGANVTWTGVLTTDAAVGIGAGSIITGDLIALDAITVGADVTWTGDVTSARGAIALGAGGKIAGSVEAFGAITLGANAESGDLTSTNGGTITLGVGAISRTIKTDGTITLAARTETCDLISTVGAITLGAGAKTGAITTNGAMVFGVGAECGDLTNTDGSITFEADAKSGAISTTHTGAVAYGEGAESGVCGNEFCGSSVCRFGPSTVPSTAPSSSPSAVPSHSPSAGPSVTPSASPNVVPSTTPSGSPTSNSS
jgi:predicted acyltransferase (DUF342 family)